MRGQKCADCGSLKIIQVMKCDLCLTSFPVNEETIRTFFHVTQQAHEVADYCPSCMLKIIDDYKKGIEARRKLV